VLLSVLLGVGLAVVRFAGGKTDAFIMRVCRRDAVVPVHPGRGC
jgi:hypothetical protein